jgi:hypothetical protein
MNLSNLTNLSSRVGFVAGIAGGMLDFTSGASLMQNNMHQTIMDGFNIAPQNYEAGYGLYALGAIVIATAVASAIPFGRRRHRILSRLMVIYGALMLLIGVAMAGGGLTMMVATPFFGLAMIVVGAIMIANGSMMVRTEMKMVA